RAGDDCFLRARFRAPPRISRESSRPSSAISERTLTSCYVRFNCLELCIIGRWVIVSLYCVIGSDFKCNLQPEITGVSSSPRVHVPP
ncbi:unnamed protein product, partial [Mycena citricolor]